jgi:radical SAM protein with 4Fe4S-binding SPASM domain
MLTLELADTVLKALRPGSFYLNLYFQGEPYLNPDFFSIVKKARKAGYYVATSTNGHYLSPENAAATVASGLSRLIVSIDGTTQETYEAYRRGGQLSKVLDGVQNMVHARSTANGKGPYLILQFLVVRPNEHQIEDARRLADVLGVDEVRFKTAQIDNYKDGHDLIPTNAKYSRYKKLATGGYRLAHTLEDRCWRMWSSLVVTWDGRVVPCCFDKDAQHAMGSLATSSLNEVWFSATYKGFRSQILTNRKNIAMCQNCTEGSTVFES